MGGPLDDDTDLVLTDQPSGRGSFVLSPRNSPAIWVVTATSLSFAVAAAGGVGATDGAGLPITVWAAIIAFGINWLVFVPSYLRTTERYYDLVGMVSYLSVIVFVWVGSEHDTRGTLLAVMISIWTVRLGWFLFRRVSADGRDLRFNKLKVTPWLFFRTWTLQAAWVTIVSSAAVAAMSAADPHTIGLFDVIGLTAWSCGLVIEAVADSLILESRCGDGPCVEQASPTSRTRMSIVGKGACHTRPLPGPEAGLKAERYCWEGLASRVTATVQLHELPRHSYPRRTVLRSASRRRRCNRCRDL